MTDEAALPPFAVVMHIEGQEKPITNYMNTREGAEQEAAWFTKLGEHERMRFKVKPHVIETGQMTLGLE